MTRSISATRIVIASSIPVHSSERASLSNLNAASKASSAAKVAIEPFRGLLDRDSMLGETLQYLHEFLCVHRFGNVLIHSAFQTTFPVTLHCMCGHRDNRNMLA